MNGLLLIDKDQGMTSHDVVAKLRKLLKISSIGHCGTLDPMATGLMVMLIGEATKLSSYLLEKDKTYRLTVRLGIQTDSLDITGKIINERNPPDISLEEKIKIAMGLQGSFSLPVPKFSAVKVQGQKLYEKARKEEDFTPPMKEMKFYDLKFIGEKKDQNELEFEISCSKGSYIRSWANLLGEKLGCGACLSGLRRLRSEPYDISQTTSLSELSKKIDAGINLKNQSFLLPMNEALVGWKSVIAEGQSLQLLKNGQIGRDLKSRLIVGFQPNVDIGAKILDINGNLLALIGLDPDRGFIIRRVFNS